MSNLSKNFQKENLAEITDLINKKEYGWALKYYRELFAKDLNVNKIEEYATDDVFVDATYYACQASLELNTRYNQSTFLIHLYSLLDLSDPEHQTAQEEFVELLKSDNSVTKEAYLKQASECIGKEEPTLIEGLFLTGSTFSFLFLLAYIAYLFFGSNRKSTEIISGIVFGVGSMIVCGIAYKITAYITNLFNIKRRFSIKSKNRTALESLYQELKSIVYIPESAEPNISTKERNAYLERIDSPELCPACGESVDMSKEACSSCGIAFV